MSYSKKDIKFTLAVGEPFKNFRQYNFFVTNSQIEPQDSADVNCKTESEALILASSLAKVLKGKLTKTTVEELEI